MHRKSSSKSLLLYIFYVQKYYTLTSLVPLHGKVLKINELLQIIDNMKYLILTGFSPERSSCRRIERHETKI